MATSRNVVLIHGSWHTDIFWNEARTEFEVRGYTVHTPVLRHHELPLMEGAGKIASLSLLDYTRDIIDYAESLDSPPLLIGHSMGGLLAQLVAARTANAGVVAATPAPAAGTFAYYPKTVKIFAPHFFQFRPWAKPIIPRWEQYSNACANMQPESEARKHFAVLVAESGRAYCEFAFPWLDRRKAATVDYAAITTPVLAIGATHDNIINPRIPRTTAKKFTNGTYTEIHESDHLVFIGKALPACMAAIDTWITQEKIFRN